MEGLFLSSRECGITAHVLKLSGIHSLFFLYYKHSCLFIVISEYICKDTEKRSSLRSKIQDMLPSLFRHSERKRRISSSPTVILSVSEESQYLSFQCKTDIIVCFSFLFMFRFDTYNRKKRRPFVAGKTLLRVTEGAAIPEPLQTVIPECIYRGSIFLACISGFPQSLGMTIKIAGMTRKSSE